VADLKTKPHSDDVGAFLAQVEDPVKRADSETLLAMMSEVSGLPPVLWGTMVGFGQYHYQYASGHAGDAFRIGFSPRKGELSLYVLTAYAGSKKEREASLLARLGKHRAGKSCLYVRKLADVDMMVLRELTRSAWDFMQERYPQ
jgi:hypothetical protein